MKCPLCGNTLKLHEGKFGQFYGCTSYPVCEFSLSIGSMSDDAIEKRLEELERAHEFLEEKHQDKECKICSDGEDSTEDFFDSLYHYLIENGKLTEKQIGSIKKHLHTTDNERTGFKYPPRQTLNEDQRGRLRANNLMK